MAEYHSTIYCLDSIPPSIGEDGFSCFTSSNTNKIFVPVKYLEDYKQQWSQYKDFIYGI
jgi:hypothetical protein